MTFKIPKPKTLNDLRRMKGIKLKDIEEYVTKMTYYNTINGTWKPCKETREALCKVFDINDKTLSKLIS